MRLARRRGDVDDHRDLRGELVLTIFAHRRREPAGRVEQDHDRVVPSVVRAASICADHVVLAVTGLTSFVELRPRARAAVAAGAAAPSDARRGPRRARREPRRTAFSPSVRILSGEGATPWPRRRIWHPADSPLVTTSHRPLLCSPSCRFCGAGGRRRAAAGDDRRATCRSPAGARWPPRRTFNLRRPALARPGRVEFRTRTRGRWSAWQPAGAGRTGPDRRRERGRARLQVGTPTGPARRTGSRSGARQRHAGAGALRRRARGAAAGADARSRRPAGDRHRAPSGGPTSCSSARRRATPVAVVRGRPPHRRLEHVHAASSRRRSSAGSSSTTCRETAGTTSATTSSSTGTARSSRAATAGSTERHRRARGGVQHRPVGVALIGTYASGAARGGDRRRSRSCSPGGSTSRTSTRSRP